MRRIRWFRRLPEGDKASLLLVILGGGIFLVGFALPLPFLLLCYLVGGILWLWGFNLNRHIQRAAARDGPQAEEGNVVSDGASSPDEELRLLIGEERYCHLEAHGYFLFEGSDGGHYAIHRDGILLRQAEINGDDAWEMLCVNPAFDEIMPREDLLMALYQWAVHDERHLRATANSQGVVRLSEVMDPYPVRPQPAPRRQATVRFVSNTIELQNPREYLRQVRQLGIDTFSVLELGDRDCVIRQLTPRDWEWPNWRIQAGQDREVRLTSFAPADTLIVLYGLQIDPRDTVHVQGLDISVGGYRVVRLDLESFYLPMPPRGEGVHPWQFIPVRYLESPVLIRDRTRCDFTLTLSAPGECTFMPLGDIVERHGEVLVP